VFHKKFSLIWTLLLSFSLSGQCPFKGVLWNKVSQLVTLPPDNQLHELLSLQDSIKKCHYAMDSAGAFLLQRIGVMYFRKADYYTAVKYTLSSLQVLEELEKTPHGYPAQKIKCYSNLSIYYDSLGLNGKMNNALDSCIAIGLRTASTDSTVLYRLSDKIKNLLDAGDYARCIDYAAMGQILADRYGLQHSNAMRRIRSWKINALTFMKDFDEVAAELKNKISEYSQSGDPSFIGNLYALWAEYYIGIGQIDSALMSYKRAVRFNLNLHSKSGYAASLNNIGILFFENLHNYKNALDYYVKALAYSDPNESISILTNIGNVYTRKNSFDSAFYFYQKAFDQIHPGMDENGLLNTPDFESLNSLSEYLITLVLDKADAGLAQYRQSGDLHQLSRSLVSYRTADQIMDKIKQSRFEIQSKLFWRKNARRLYEHAIEACWLEKNKERVLYFFEKSRAALLDDKLKEDRFMQDREAIELFQIKATINSLEKQMDTSDAQSEKYAHAKILVIEEREKQDKLLMNIREKDPLYYARTSNIDTISIREVQKTILKDHQAVIEIFDGDSSVFALMITREGSGLSKIDKYTYDSLSHLFLSFLSREDILNNQFPAFANTSRILYELIFAGIPLPRGRIIISPDGACFPFEALIENNKNGIHYLIEDHTISYTYSARYLMNPFPMDRNKKQIDFFGMAPVGYAAYLNLAPLLGSDMSLNKIQSYFRSPFVSVSESATKRNFLSNFSDYRIIQLYSHASYNESAAKPLIYFADSSMDLSELFSRDKPAARLVVLSACETALGKEYKGEGVFSFSREFASLGIPASVSNLWSVDNESTYQITEWFYQFVADGLPTDEALKQAKLKFMKESTGEKKLPYYWASPILTGKAEIIRTKSRFPFMDIIVVLGITGLALWFMKRKRSPKKVAQSSRS
jgi:CHAT domain-containing protein